MSKKSRRENKIKPGAEKSPGTDKNSEKSKYIRRIILLCFIGAAVFGALKSQFSDKISDEDSAALHSEEVREIPVKGTVTLLDLGATECVPCKMMAPILAELKKTYKDKAAVLFIDVWKQPEYSRKFGIRSIPTQIFFDKEGKEVFRHTGFMDKKSIIEKMKALGISEPV